MGGKNVQIRLCSDPTCLNSIRVKARKCISPGGKQSATHAFLSFFIRLGHMMLTQETARSESTNFDSAFCMPLSPVVDYISYWCKSRKVMTTEVASFITLDGSSLIDGSKS